MRELRGIGRVMKRAEIIAQILEDIRSISTGEKTDFSDEPDYEMIVIGALEASLKEIEGGKNTEPAAILATLMSSVARPAIPFIHITKCPSSILKAVAMHGFAARWTEL
jgi:hypothetical protein